MPLTPYHVGPALLVALLLYPVLDIPTFIVASLILDLEPLAVILGYVNWPMHGIFHSITIGTIVGVVLALPMYLIRKYTKPISIGKVTPDERNIKNIIITSVLGVWVHVLLDSFLYADLNLFYPIQWNPLLGLIPEQMIINFCLISLPVAFIIYMIRSTVLTWLRPTEELYTEPVEQVIEGIPENEPYIIYYAPESIS